MPLSLPFAKLSEAPVSRFAIVRSAAVAGTMPGSARLPDHAAEFGNLAHFGS